MRVRSERRGKDKKGVGEGGEGGEKRKSVEKT